MQPKLLDFSKEINNLNHLLDSKWELNPFRGYIVAETFNTAIKFAQYHFSTTPILFYCSHIVRERANITNWRRKIPRSIILACDPPLLFAQKLAIEQMLFQKVNEQYSGKEQAYKAAIEFIHKEHSKFFLNLPKSWKAAKNIDKDIELKNIKSTIDNDYLRENSLLEKFTLQSIYESSLNGMKPSEHLIKTIIEYAFSCQIHNNDILLEEDFLTLKAHLLESIHFAYIPYCLNISPEMFKSNIAKKLFFTNELPGYADEQEHIKAMRAYSLMEDEAIYVTDIEYDVIPAILNEEKNLTQTIEDFSDRIKKQYLNIYIKNNEKG